jgi:uncharacterized damage-inducible protein DinB
MTTPADTMSPSKANGLGALAFARRYLNGLLEEFPADKLTAQPVAGGNHAMWIVGHLAYCDDLFMAHLGGPASTFPQEWMPLFKDGSEPVDDPSRYPAPGELRKVLDERREALMAWMEGLSDEKLAEPLPGDFSGFASCYGELMSTMAAHECLHAGQLTVVRKALGLGRKFM